MFRSIQGLMQKIPEQSPATVAPPLVDNAQNYTTQPDSKKLLKSDPTPGEKRLCFFVTHCLALLC